MGQDVTISAGRRTEPLVSTLIPTFNRAPQVVRAVASALAQTHSNQQVLVIDDGSTDDTRARLASAFGDRIEVLSKPNGGVSSARNLGLARARGSLIAFLDSDDTWHPRKLERQVAFLDSHPDFGLVLTDLEWVGPDGRQQRIQHRRASLPEDGDLLRWVLREPTMVPSSALLRREVVDAVGDFDTGLQTAEDIDLYLRVAARFKIGLVEQPLTRYQSGGDSLSAPGAAFDDYARVLERFAASSVSALSRGERVQILFHTYERCARGLLWMGDYRAATRFVGRALLHVRDHRAAARLLGTGARALIHLTRWRGN